MSAAQVEQAMGNFRCSPIGHTPAQISATLYGVFSRGLLTGSKPTEAGDWRAHQPRFAGENGAKNEDSVKALQRFAHERGMTPGRLALAWVLARQSAFVPVVGAKTRA
jgi:aryl-alcohol dehydrogenase-like predicted oxidoreductase